MIVAEHLRKTFPGKGKKAAPVIAVDDVSFTAHDGQITGLLGPNGAGKTTTMRMLYTLMQPEKGRVLVDGIDVGQDANAVRRSLGVLPDARGVYKRLTARENIAYFGELHGLSPAQVAERTRTLAEALQMEDVLDAAVRGLQPGPAHQDRDRPRAGARPAQRDPGRAHQRPGRDDHPRPARLPASSCARRGVA
jgi:sodium transport system ATP-binding protein